MSEHGLTPRQVEIVRLFSLGCSVKETAKLLELAPSTVDNHNLGGPRKFGRILRTQPRIATDDIDAVAGMASD